MEYLFIQREGDKEAIACLLQEFRELSKLALVTEYNQVQKTGIVGSHAQAQPLVALHLAFKAVFKPHQLSSNNNSLLAYRVRLHL
jgi:hypothetical protein